jgi:hypothetical protein
MNVSTRQLLAIVGISLRREQYWREHGFIRADRRSGWPFEWPPDELLRAAILKRVSAVYGYRTFGDLRRIPDGLLHCRYVLALRAKRGCRERVKRIRLAGTPSLSAAIAFGTKFAGSCLLIDAEELRFMIDDRLEALQVKACQDSAA